MDLAQYIALKQRQHLFQSLGGIAAAEGRGYGQNVQALARGAADPYARLGRAAGLVMFTGLARRAALQQAAATSANRSIGPAVLRAQSTVRTRLLREKQGAIAQQKALQRDRARTAAILGKLTTVEKTLKNKNKKNKKKR